MQDTYYQLLLPQALVTGILSCLDEIVYQNSFADKAVGQLLNTQKRWGSRDRKLAAGIIYDISRNLLLYQFQLQEALSENIDKSVHLLDLIALSVQNQEAFSKYITDNELFQSKIKNIKNIPAYILYGVSEWLYELLKMENGENADALLNSLNRVAPTYIRPNLLKTDTSKLAEILEQAGIIYSVSKQVKDCIKIEQANQLRKSKTFNNGLFEFQDIGSQYLISELQLKQNQTIIDYCAGKGGKTLHIASLMKNKGLLIASDIDSTRLSQLVFRAERAGLKNLKILTQSDLDGKVQTDIVLVDAPCSGSGTFRRQPDLKYRLQQEALSAFIKTQSKILDKASKLVKKDGQLVYITCSILKKENQEQVKQFIQTHPLFSLQKEENIFPERLDGDAFYMAVFNKS
ncbi:MAG: RsmB/NOP family class I SAM-dependent RNA methyltransferase [Chitinophagales bacterium]|nr:RsmB/NOP family class I SAM-dependent RNA methyltransferase [Chitinophagales bacterium]